MTGKVKEKEPTGGALESYWGELEEEYRKLSIYPDEPDEEPIEKITAPTDIGKRLRQVKYIEAYIACGGNLGAAAKISRISRAQAWRWFKDEWFQKQINERMHEWELLMRAKMFQLAMNGNTTMLIFLSKFLNPFYDDVYRSKVLLGEMAQSLYERYPIPEPKFLPPEIPARFGPSGPDNGASQEGASEVPTSLVHSGGDR